MANKKEKSKAKKKTARTAEKKQYKYGPPLTEEEAEELGELIAELAEGDSLQDIGETDGFMLGMRIHPSSPPVREMLGMMFPFYNNDDLEAEPKRERLRKLLLRRYEDIGKQLRNSEIFEPYYGVDGDEETLTVEQQEEYLAPFISIFLQVISQVEEREILDDGKWVVGLTKLLSIFSDLEEVSEEEQVALNIEKEIVTSAEDVLCQLASAIALIASSLRGYPLNPLIDEQFDLGAEDKITPSVT